MIMGSSLSAVIIDFTSAEGFTNGNASGQVSWVETTNLGLAAPFTIQDAAGAGDLVPTADGIAHISRSFTNGELGGTFDNTSSIISFDIKYRYSSVSSLGTGSETIFRLGDNGSSTGDFELWLGQDGVAEVVGSSLSDPSGSIHGSTQSSINTTYSLSGTVDYATDTFNVTSSLGGGSISGSFIPGSPEVSAINLDSSNNFATGLIIESITYSLVPEPTSSALLLIGAGALLAFSRRRGC